MTKIINWITDHPLISGFILGALVLAFTVKIGSLEIDSSAEGLMVEGDPARDYYEEVKDTFGSDALTVVVLKARNIFNPRILRLIEKLTDTFKNVDGVSRVESLTTVNKIKGEDDFLNTDKLINYIPDSKAEINRIKEDALSNYIFLDNIISPDAKISAINIYTEAPKGDKDFNARITQKIDEIIADYQNQVEIYQLGGPLTKITYTSYIRNDMSTLMPLAALILVIILIITFRSTVGVIIPLLTSTLSILCTLGFMTLMNYPINVITAIIPALLIAVGSTEDVHMLNEYYAELMKGHRKKDAIKGMGARCGLPILLTSLTTFLGFLTLSINKITILRQFGIISAFGLIINFLITILAVPLALRIFGTTRILKKKPAVAKKSLLDKILEKIAAVNTKRRPVIYCLTPLIIILAIIGCLRVRVNTDFICYFKEDSFIRKRFNSLHAELSGALNFYIVTETGEPDKAKNPQILKAVDGLQEYIAKKGYFDKTVSVTDYLKVMNREMNASNKAYEVIPDSQNLVAQYLLFMDEREIARYLNNDYSTVNLAVRHNITSSWELNEILKDLRKYIAENFPEGLKVKFTGENILINAAADAMAKGQAASLSLALLAIFVIMTFLFLSIKIGLLSMIPNMIPILLNFGLMGWLKIPLNTGTCMVAAIALGIAIDDTIHFMTRYNRELKNSSDQSEVICNTTKGEGRPILSTSVALALGFGCLTLSNFNPTIYFGFLSAHVMIVALLSDLFITPSLLYSVRLITLWDMITTKIKKELTEISPLFNGLTNHEAKKVVILGGLKSFPKESLIIKQGDVGKDIYMVVLGRLRVSLEREGSEVELATLAQGDIVGEMGAVSKEGIRSANVRALEDSDLLLIDSQTLERIRRKIPKTAAKLFLNMSKILGQRLNKANRQLLGP